MINEIKALAERMFKNNIVTDDGRKIKDLSSVEKVNLARQLLEMDE